MNPIFTSKFWADAIERVVSTVAQAEITVFGLASTTDVVTMSVNVGLRTAAYAAVACLLKCLAATRVGAENTAAMLPVGPDTDKG